MHDDSVRTPSRAVARAGAVAVVIAAAAASEPFLAGYVLPQRGFLLLATASFADWSPALLAVVLGLGLLLRRWLVAAVLAVLLCAQLAVLAPAHIGDDPGRGTPVVVLTSNLLYGQANPAALVRMVRDRDVDVLAVQELTPQAVDRLRAAGLEQLLPHSRLQPLEGPRGAGLWSRYPLSDVPRWPSAFGNVAADLSVAGTRVRVRSLHPPPPTHGLRAAWEADYVAFASAARRETEEPVLLLGDFNATVHHRRLRTLMGDRWRDAGEVAGAGLVRTWRRESGPDLFAPDHVLVERGMGVRRFATVSVRGSDHRAVVTTVVLPTRR
jgi:endonuclease/exonuclease/phosphatase family metal-dependent hydrolase